MGDITLSSTATLPNGVEMPLFGLGTYMSESSDARIRRPGYRLIDTAAFYENEAEVGEAIRASGVLREDIFVTTKLWISDMGPKAKTAIEKSLRLLDIGYIDLYLIHHPGVSSVCRSPGEAAANKVRSETWAVIESYYRAANDGYNWLCWLTGVLIITSANFPGLVESVCGVVAAADGARRLFALYLHVYVLVGIVAVWRGLWYSWDGLTVPSHSSVGDLGLSAATSHILGTMMLASARHMPTMLSPPVTGVPLPSRYLHTEWCGVYRWACLGVSRSDNYVNNRLHLVRGRYVLATLLDFCFNLIFVGFGVVSFWRGTWVLMDVFLLSMVTDTNNKLGSSLIGLLCGYSTLVVILLGVQLKPMCEKAACVAIWRGYWYLMDELVFPSNSSASTMATLLGGACVLLLLSSFSAALASPALVIDSWKPSCTTWSPSTDVPTQMGTG